MARDLANGLEHGAPDVLKVMLHPAGLGKVLLKIDARIRNPVEIPVHEERGGARGALIDREDEFHLDNVPEKLSHSRRLASLPIRGVDESIRASNF